ncbi:MAG: PEP-CTERM sorting domain-containing protein [Aliiglaciecola sp.]|uniref:PEP-CTERM sorting domain-containing protein n=1 Tax=Aliiglaciecola sp. TaxID=1872441 RepID=UPI0032971EAC
MKNKFLKALVASFILAISGLANAGLITYATSGSGGAISDLYTVDIVTGDTTLIGNTGLALNSIAFYNGVLYGTERLGGSLVSINTDTGESSVIGALGTNVTSFAISNSGEAFGWSESSDDAVSINLLTGATSVLGDAGVFSATHGLAFADDMLVFFNADGNFYDVNELSGSLSLISSTGLDRFSRGAIDGDISSEDGLYYGLTWQELEFGINKLNYTDGSFEGFIATDVQLHTLTFAGTTEVPEPSTLAVFALGLIGLASRKFKKQA